MLRPHDRENAELDKVRLAAERFEDSAIFLVAEPVLGDHFGGDARSFEDVHGGAPSRPTGASLDVVPEELLAGEDEGLRASVDEVGEARALGRPALFTDAPQIVANRRHR